MQYIGRPTPIGSGRPFYLILFYNLLIFNLADGPGGMAAKPSDPVADKPSCVTGVHAVGVALGLRVKTLYCKTLTIMEVKLYPREPVLIVDDEEAILQHTAALLETSGINNLETCSESGAVIELLRKRDYAALILDLAMPQPNGESILAIAREEFPGLPVIIVTGAGDIGSAVRCMKAGATDYLAKPVEPTHFTAAIKRLLELGETRQECADIRDSLLRGELRKPECFSELIAVGARMKALFQYAEAIAHSARTVLIQGETGTGKELLARAIHRASGRPGPLVCVNIAGIDDTMFSDTLFGHTRGAFTGALEARKGLLVQADSGTILLDEIGDLLPASQVKLLRLLESSEFFPLGSDLPRRTAARFIVSTHQNLATLVKEGRFRRDLYYRINAYELRIPPLRERREDIAPILEGFIESAAREAGIRPPRYPVQLPILLGTYAFPGNVRELRSLVYGVLSRHGGGTLPLSPFAEGIGAALDTLGPEDDRDPEVRFGSVLPTLRRVTDALVKEALLRAEGNPGIAAGLLGISRQALAKRLRHREDSGAEAPI